MEFVTTEELARLLRRDPSTLRRWRTGSLMTTQRYLHPDRRSIEDAGPVSAPISRPVGPQMVPHLRASRSRLIEL